MTGTQNNLKTNSPDAPVFPTLHKKYLKGEKSKKSKKSSKLIIGLGVAAVFPVGLAVGVPFGTLLLVGAFLLCPLMMMFMMNGMQNGSCHSEKDKTTADDSSIGTQADKNWLR